MKTFIFVMLLGFLSGSMAVAGLAEYLTCYNELHAPAAPVSLFGVPSIEELPAALSRLATNNKFRSPLTNKAYIVTSKSILRGDFTGAQQEELGAKTSRRASKLVHVSGAPVLELDSKLSGRAGRTYFRATWESDIDHPNGAHLVISEVAKVQGPVEKFSKGASLTPESQNAVIAFLKDEVAERTLLQRAPARAYKACHAIPELKEYLESKMDSFSPESPVNTVERAKSDKPRVAR